MGVLPTGETLTRGQRNKVTSIAEQHSARKLRVSQSSESHHGLDLVRRSAKALVAEYKLYSGKTTVKNPLDTSINLLFLVFM